MIKITDLKIGQKVHHKSVYTEKYKNGLVREITNSGVHVVYNCDNKWHFYKNYTSVLTSIEDLYLGWRNN